MPNPSLQTVSRPFLALLLASGLSACATGSVSTGDFPMTAGTEAAFANRGAVPGDNALFDPARCSAEVAGISGGTGEQRGYRICPRADQLVDPAPLAAASIGALKGGAASPAPKAFTAAANLPGLKSGGCGPDGDAQASRARAGGRTVALPTRPQESTRSASKVERIARNG